MTNSRVTSEASRHNAAPAALGCDSLSWPVMRELRAFSHTQGLGDC